MGLTSDPDPRNPILRDTCPEYLQPPWGVLRVMLRKQHAILSDLAPLFRTPG